MELCKCKFLYSTKYLTFYFTRKGSLAVTNTPQRLSNSSDIVLVQQSAVNMELSDFVMTENIHVTSVRTINHFHPISIYTGMKQLLVDRSFPCHRAASKKA